MTHVFTRKIDEAFHIGDTIRVLVGDIRGDRGRLVIEAPPSVPVLRAEIRGADIPAKQIYARKDFTRLVLTRSKGEMIYIGDDIRITIVEIRGDRIRLGIEAPRSVAVDREEVRLKKIAGNNPAKRAA